MTKTLAVNFAVYLLVDPFSHNNGSVCRGCAAARNEKGQYLEVLMWLSDFCRWFRHKVDHTSTRCGLNGKFEC